MKHPHTFTPAILLLLIHATSSTAQVPTLLSNNPASAWYLVDAEQGWHFDAFLGVESEPTYAGSDKNDTELDADVRAFYVTQNGHRLFVKLGEIGAIANVSDHTQAVFFLEYEEGREADDDPVLANFEPVRSTVEGQFGLYHRWSTTYASVVLQPDLLDRGKGFVWFAGIGRDWAPTENTRISANVDISGGDSTHMRAEFEVTPTESAASGLAAYKPSGGLKSISIGLSAEYMFSRQWSVLTDIEVEHYFSEAADSPLIAVEGSDQTYEAGVSLRYRF